MIIKFWINFIKLDKFKVHVPNVCIPFTVNLGRTLKKAKAKNAPVAKNKFFVNVFKQVMS